MKSAASNATFNDVQCGTCKKHFDFGCVNMTETGWKKLGPDRRALWKCATCRASSTSPSVHPVSEPVSNETILSEIRELKEQLAGISSLRDDVRSIKVELGELKASFDFNSAKVDEFAAKITNIESRVISLETLENKVQSLEVEIASIKLELSTNDQRSRLNNIEIKGIPLKKEENLFTILETISKKVNYPVPKNQVNYISRVPVFNSKDKSIVVSFLNRYFKEDFIAAARSLKGLSTHDLGFDGPAVKVFINDHLNPESKKLLNKTRLLAKERDFKYVWVKHGKIHVRKLDGSHVFIVARESDLNKLL